MIAAARVGIELELLFGEGTVLDGQAVVRVVLLLSPTSFF